MKILDKKDMERIKRSIDSYESCRDSVNHQSRDIIRLSKKIIYSLHRNDIKNATSSVKRIKTKISQLNKTVSKEPKLRTSGAFKVAIQEYIEAITFYDLLKHNRISPNSKLGVDPEYYLLGLIDLVGELVRRAINSAIKEDYETSVKLKDLVSELYDELLLFDFAGGELRKKFDSIKYDLKKLEDLVLSLKLNGKI